MIACLVIAELHCHSKSTKLPYFPLFYDAVMTVEEIIEACIRKKIEILAVTDHDSLNGYKKAVEIVNKRDLKIIVVPGCEVTSADGHILAYGIHKEIPMQLSAQKTIELIHKQGGIAVAAHPFIPFYSLGKKVFSLDLDGLEGECSASTKIINKKSIRAAKKLNLPAIGGSDAHTIRGVGTGTTVFDGNNLKKWEDVIEAIKNNEFTRNISFQSWLSIGWENIWNNIRISLSI